MHSRHFSEKELSCRCGCGLNVASRELLELAEGVRAILGVPMIVHSATRCESHNKAVGGVANSKHTIGSAMDFHAKGLDNEAVYNVLTSDLARGLLPQLGGVGLYDWGLHIDTYHAPDGHLRRWDCRSKK